MNKPNNHSTNIIENIQIPTSSNTQINYLCNNNQLNNNLNNTKYLIDDTMGMSNNSLLLSNYSNLKNAIVQSKLNNTQNLLNDKASMVSMTNDRLLTTNNSDLTRFKEKYKDLLPEINLQLSLNKNKEDEEKITKNTEKNFIKNPSKYGNLMPFNSNNTMKSKKDIFIIDNIKEENENTETINLAENNTLQNENQKENFNSNMNDYSPLNTEEGGYDKKNANLYCLTNSNIDNKFYSSILETNEFFNNGNNINYNKPDKDENVDMANDKLNKEKGSFDQKFSIKNLEEEYEKERLLNQKYLENLKNLNYEYDSLKKGNSNNYEDEQIEKNNPERENINQRIISFRNNNEIDKSQKFETNEKFSPKNHQEIFKNDVNSQKKFIPDIYHEKNNFQIEEKEDLESIENFTHRNLNNYDNHNKYKSIDKNNHSNKGEFTNSVKNQHPNSNTFNNFYSDLNKNSFLNQTDQANYIEENYMKHNFISNQNFHNRKNQFQILNNLQGNYQYGRNDNLSLNNNNSYRNQLNYVEDSQSEDVQYTNILDVLEIDKEFINFSASFPGEILSFEILVRNISNIDACFEVEFSKEENLLNTFKKYYQSDVNEIFESVPNSQNKYNCFSISYFEENNNFSEMEKIRIYLKKGHKTKIILCLKTPEIKKKLPLFACLEFNLVTNNIITERNMINTNESFLLNGKYFKNYIPILASIEVPKLLCLKELFSEKSKFPFISLLLQVSSKGQKFKIPFKNFSLKEMELELIFEKTSSNCSIFTFESKFYESQFMCFPNKFTISSMGVFEVDLIAKIKKFKINNNENIEISKIGNKVRKVLIAKIKNANVYYSFFIEASFIKKNKKQEE